MITLSDRCIEAMARSLWHEDHGAADADEVVSEGKPNWMHYRHDASAALTALLSELDAAGWRIVPKVATEEMQDAGVEDENEWRRMPMPKVRMKLNWESMLAAAPHPFPEDKS